MQVLDTPPTALDDAALRRALAGDVQAFGDLYLACLPVIFRYIRFRVGDQALAQDLAETTFLRAWEARRRLAAALEQLDDVGRDVLTMRFVMEMSHAQVAAHLGRSQESIRVIQFRALRKLRARLQEGDGR